MDAESTIRLPQAPLRKVNRRLVWLADQCERPQRDKFEEIICVRQYLRNRRDRTLRCWANVPERLSRKRRIDSFGSWVAFINTGLASYAFWPIAPSAKSIAAQFLSSSSLTGRAKSLLIATGNVA